MYDHELKLISYPLTQDEVGNEISGEPVETSILCEVLSVGRNEFYAAASTEFKPTIVFKVHRFEYNQEAFVRYEDGVRYKVIRSYTTGTEEIELTCERADQQ